MIDHARADNRYGIQHGLTEAQTVNCFDFRVPVIDNNFRQQPWPSRK